jgi:hypothetical protein
MAHSPVHECVFLERRLRAELRGRIRQLRIEHRENGIALLGLADSYYSKQLAQASVMGSSALPIVSNEITVTYF